MLWHQSASIIMRPRSNLSGITLSFSLWHHRSSFHSLQPDGLVPRLLDSLFYLFLRDLLWLIVHIDGIQDRVDLYISYPAVLSELLTNYLRARCAAHANYSQAEA